MSTERKPLLKKKPSGKFKMADFQRTDLARLDELDNSANWSEMGCVSGSTLIQFNRAGKGFQMRVDKAYQAFHGLNNHPNSNWNPNIETRVQSFIDDRIRLSRMFDIVDSGDKQTILITTESGLKLKLTPEHLVLTEEGWVEAKDTLGHSVVRRGDKSGKSINYVDLETNLRSLGNGRFIDKDGYVRILAYGHPRANRSNHVYEHILVMEEELGEYISEGFHVHHIDGNRSNNAYENLELKTVFEHLSDHARVRGFGTYGTKFDPVVSIEDGPVEPVYDLTMNEDYPNFVASGIVVHNSFKTTTAEWLMARKLRNIPNPRVLVVTTKSGKGTYFESLPEVLPEWDVFAVTNQRVMPVIGSRPVPISVEFPNPLYMRPVIAVAHYHCFTNRACVPQEIKEVKIINGNEVKVPILDQATGLFKMTTPKLGFLLHNHWDMVILDEAHRIKNQDSQWTHNIKKISATYKHVMTGTGFINNPAEVWSLLNFLFPKTYTSYWKFREKYCNTPDAPIYMADLSFKKLGDIEIGDKVMGWTRSGYNDERKMCSSEVLNVMHREAPVAKVTMKSGRTIKCTLDHKWVSGKRKGSTDYYITVLNEGERTRQEPATLLHVVDVPAKLPVEKERSAIYLGAAMDCEGSWPVLAQCSVANPEVRARMKSCLDELELPYTESNHFYLNGGSGKTSGLTREDKHASRQTVVNFRNWCNPAKLQKMIDVIVGTGRWGIKDEIDHIEFLGTQEVISMTTSTGNYVAWGYASKNCEEEEYNGYRKVVGIKKETEEEFRELVRRVGVRRSMLECFPNIKEPIKSTIPVDLNPVQKKMYVEILKDLNTMDAMGVPLFSPNVLSMLNRLRQICVATPEVVEDRYDAKLDRRIIRVKLTEPSSKLDALMELIEGLEWSIEDKQQLVVFSNFKDPLELLKVRLDKAKIPYIHMSANDNEKVRYEKWHDIWPKKEHQVFLCTLAVGSESINLTSAHRAVFLDQSWSPKDNNQAIGRIYRPGQTGATQLIYIRAEGTVDDRILHANEEKTGWFQLIFGNMLDAEKEETEDDSDS